MSDNIISLDTLEKSQCFTLYYYEEILKEEIPDLPMYYNASIEQEVSNQESIDNPKYVKRWYFNYILRKVKNKYKVKNISKEDIFYYVMDLSLFMKR